MVRRVHRGDLNRVIIYGSGLNLLFSIFPREHRVRPSIVRSFCVQPRSTVFIFRTYHRCVLLCNAIYTYTCIHAGTFRDVVARSMRHAHDTTRIRFHNHIHFFFFVGEKGLIQRSIIRVTKSSVRLLRLRPHSIWQHLRISFSVLSLTAGSVPALSFGTGFQSVHAYPSNVYFLSCFVLHACKYNRWHTDSWVAPPPPE